MESSEKLTSVSEVSFQQTPHSSPTHSATHCQLAKTMELIVSYRCGECRAHRRVAPPNWISHLTPLRWTMSSDTAAESSQSLKSASPASTAAHLALFHPISGYQLRCSNPSSLYLRSSAAGRNHSTLRDWGVGFSSLVELTVKAWVSYSSSGSSHGT